MSYEPNHEQARTTALAAKHAVRALAQCLTANQREISPEDVDALAIDMREILTSSQAVLYEIETATRDRDESNDVRDARHCLQDATRSLTQSYSAGAVMGSGEGYTRITEASEIEALERGRELIVDGTVYRVWQPSGQPVRVGDLERTELWSPKEFTEQFRQSTYGILLRH